MASNQQFCLKWNNHHGNLTSVFDELLQSQSLVDVTLACDGSSIKAHKVVLSACSPFFQDLFNNNPCKHPIVILKDLKYADMTAIVKFMYKGEVNVSQDRLSTLLKTAESLKIKGLAEMNNDGSNDNVESNKVMQKVPEPKMTRMTAIKSRKHRMSSASPSPATPSSNSRAESPEIIEQIPPKIRKPSHQPEPPVANPTHEFTADETDYSIDIEPASIASQASHSDDYSLQMTYEQTPESAKFDMGDGYDPNWGADESNDDIGVKTEQIRPIQLDQEISRVKQQVAEFDNYDPGNSADSFGDQSLQGPSDSQQFSDMNQSQSSTNTSFVQGGASTSSECMVCHKIFKYRASMLNHFAHKHKNGGKMHECHLCSQQFKWKSQLLNHLDSVHRIVKEFECLSCGKFFHHFSKLETHHYATHSNVPVSYKRHNVPLKI